jgi:hypothetical protein
MNVLEGPGGVEAHVPKMTEVDEPSLSVYTVPGWGAVESPYVGTPRAVLTRVSSTDAHEDALTSAEMAAQAAEEDCGRDSIEFRPRVRAQFAVVF